MTPDRAPPPAAGPVPDPRRMARERRARLAAAMERHGVPALLLLGRAAVQYATGALWPLCDAGHAHAQPTLALVSADDPLPHLFSDEGELALADLPADHVHAGAHVECARGVCDLAARVRGLLGARIRGPLGVDEATAAMHVALPALLPEAEIVDAQPVVGAARLVKTPDEVACIRRAQAINDRAMVDVQAALRPGVTPCELSAVFLAAICRLGAAGNLVDPIWQAMPARRAELPFTVNGEIAFPLPSGTEPLAAGAAVWVDTGITYQGYVSDFGRTWIVGDAPSPAERALFARWRDVLDRALAAVRPGATAADLTRAASAGEPRPPWLRHLYLAHGAGLESAETPFVGSDLGDACDAGFVLEPGMVLVLEPVVWEDGVGGHRAEESVVVTATGHERLSSHPYAPFA
jgi:Xaa-Pro dipeptidase